MIAALTFVPRRTPMGRAGALAASAYLGGFVAVAFGFSHPLVLASDAVAVVIAGLLAGTGRALAASARFAAWLAVLMVATNAIASQRGDTVWVRGPDLPVLGTVDVTAEAIAEGGILALRVAIVIAAFAVFTAAVDPDRVLAPASARRTAIRAHGDAGRPPGAAGRRGSRADSRRSGPARPCGGARFAAVARSAA